MNESKGFNNKHRLEILINAPIYLNNNKKLEPKYLNKNIETWYNYVRNKVKVWNKN